MFGVNHPRAIKARARLGTTLGQAGRYADAEVELRRALEASTLHLGPDHRETLATQEELALSLMDAGKLAAALPAVRGRPAAPAKTRRPTGPQPVDAAQ